MSQPGFSPNPNPYPGPVPPTPQARPSGWWIALGVLTIVAGIIGAIVTGVLGFSRMNSAVNGFERVSVPGSGDVRLEADHDYTIYFEYNGASSTDLAQDLRVKLVDPAGQSVKLETYGSETTYQLGGREGRAGISFHAAQGGTYHLASEGGSGVTMAVGGGIGSSIATTILSAFGIAGVGFILGLIIIVITVVRRSRVPQPVRGYGPAAPPWIR